MTDSQKSASVEARERLIRRVNSLPVLPHVVTRVMALDSNATTFFDELVALLETEPNYAVRVVAAANSVVTRGVSPITRLKDAVVRLGAKESVSLILTMSVVHLFTPGTDAERGLWMHAFEVAALSRVLSAHAERQLDPENAYLCGLLHDVGRFIMFQVVPEVIEEADEALVTDFDELLARERALCGLDHADVGAQACARWGLPAPFTTFVQQHHAKDIEARLGGSAGLVGRLVQAADLAVFSSRAPASMPARFSSFAPEARDEALHPVLPPWYPRRPGLGAHVWAALSHAQALFTDLGLAR
ncbi:MAG: HDOD domain-containing protein [Myxococcaceae bacterium]|nr:HDOD domain-containing protein [Myxococcaceae bacterium]